MRDRESPLIRTYVRTGTGTGTGPGAGTGGSNYNNILRCGLGCGSITVTVYMCVPTAPLPPTLPTLARRVRLGMRLALAGGFRRHDREIVLATVAIDGLQLEYASEELRADREVVLKAVAKCGRALAYASVELCADREVVLAAVAQKVRDGPAHSSLAEAPRMSVYVCDA